MGDHANAKCYIDGYGITHVMTLKFGLIVHLQSTYLLGDGTPRRIVRVGDGDLDKLGQIIRSTVRMIVLGLRQEAVQRLIGDPWHATVVLSSQTRRPEVIF